MRCPGDTGLPPTRTASKSDRPCALAAGGALFAGLNICPGRRGTTEPTTMPDHGRSPMRRSLFGAALVGAFLLVTSFAHGQTGAALPTVPAEQAGMSAKKLERIREALATEIDQGKLPGAVVLVARKG